jgi:uncharacterized protein (TIGR00251 family)
VRGVENLDIRDTPAGAELPVKVVPGASRDAVAGVLGDALKVTTTAPAEKGRANEAVAKLLARRLGLDPRSVRIVRGRSGARKSFRFNNTDKRTLHATLNRL